MTRPPSDSEPSHGVSRRSAVAAVELAPSWSELFEAANVALSLDRSEWGDEFEQSWAALELWQRCAFVVASAPRIEMGPAGADPSTCWSSASVAGSDVERESFAAAKAIASALLSELPATARDERGRVAPGAPHPLAEAVTGARGRVESILAQLRAREMADPLHFAGSMPTPKGEAINLLIGTSSWAAMKRLRELEAPARGKSWPDLWAAGNMGPKNSALSRRVEAACAEVSWREALRSGGFAYIASGPTGGARQSAREATALARASRDFSRELERLGLPEVGLGGLGVSINASPVGDYSNAAFESWRFDMVFKAPFAPTSLHHEWTHALDRMTRQAGDPGAREALRTLELSLDALAPDDAALSRHVEESASRLRAASRRLWRVESRFALRACLPPGSPREGVREIAQACARLVWDNSSRDNFSAGWREAVDQLQAKILPGQAPIDEPFVRSLMLELRGARRELDELLRARAEGTSAFAASSRAAAAKIGADPADYWLAPDEVLARAGQAFFARLLPAGQLDPNGRILLGGHPQTVHPEGAERSALRAPLESWVRSMAPTATAAIEARRSKNALPARAASMREATDLARRVAERLRAAAAREVPAPIPTREAPVSDFAIRQAARAARVSSVFGAPEDAASPGSRNAHP